MTKMKSLKLDDVEISRLIHDENYNEFLLESPNYQNIANILMQVYFNPERADITRHEIEDVVSHTNPSDLRDAFILKIGSGSVVEFTIKNFDKLYEVDMEKTRDLAKQKKNYEEHKNNGYSYAHDKALSGLVLKDGTFFDTRRRLYIEWRARKDLSEGSEYDYSQISLAPLDRIGIYDFLDNRPGKIDAEVGSPKNYLSMNLTKDGEIYRLGLQSVLWHHRKFFMAIGVESR